MAGNDGVVKTTARARWPRRLGALAVVALLGALGAAEGLARLLVSPASRAIPAVPGATRVALPRAGGGTLSAWRFDLEGARGTAVLAHGYRSDRNQFTSLVPALARRGLRALAFDFQAHGESAGQRISFGPDESRDVAAALDHAATLGGPVVYVGFSMGAASYLLSGREAHAAVLDSPYDTLDDALLSRGASFGLPRPLGGVLLSYVSLRMPYAPRTVRPVDRARALRRPTLFVFAERDHWVPSDAQRRYREALPPVARAITLRGATHGDHFTPSWAEAVAGFLGAVL